MYSFNKLEINIILFKKLTNMLFAIHRGCKKSCVFGK